MRTTRGKESRYCMCFFFSSRRRHTRFDCDWSSDVCSSDLATGMSRSLWFLLALGSAAVLWTAHPGGLLATKPRWLFTSRMAALFVLVCALMIFRGKAEDGHIVWLQHSWWGILGLIGWAYLNCSLVYLAVRGNPTALMGVMGFMIALFIGGRHGLLDRLGPVKNLVGVGGELGSHPPNVMDGVLVWEPVRLQT